MTNKKVNNRQHNINGIATEKVYDLNFLGLTLNENINWKNHIEQKCYQKLKNNWNFKQTQVYPSYSNKIIVVQYITPATY